MSVSIGSGSVQGVSVTRRVLRLLPWILIVGLLFSNAAMVLSEQALTVASKLIEGVAALAGAKVAATVRGASPTEKLKLLRGEREILRTEKKTLETLAATRSAAVKRVTTRSVASLGRRTATAVKTLPSRAIPYIGISALVAFTMVELQQDCELARELVKLNAVHENEPVDVGEVCEAVEGVPTPEELWNTAREGAISIFGSISNRALDYFEKAGEALDFVLDEGDRTNVD